MKSIYTLLTVHVLFAASAFAHDDSFGLLKGEKLSLYYTDHGMAGHINEHLVYASPLEKEFGIKLVHRAKAVDYFSEFKKTSDGFSGTIQSAKADPTAFKLTLVSPKDGVIQGKLGADDFRLVISSEEMDGHHYVNPRFVVEVAGKTYRFHVENGQVCMGCATKIAFVVLGMLRTTGAL